LTLRRNSIVFFYVGDRGELVLDALDADGGYSGAGEGAEEDAAEGVAEGYAEAGEQGSGDDPGEALTALLDLDLRIVGGWLARGRSGHALIHLRL
jgi:hypothetical protein